jgi:hypothetical protein
VSVSLQSSAVLAVSSAALFAAHQVGDYWLQTHGQAMGKGGAGWAARAACARHVLVLVAVKVVALVSAFAVTGLPVRPGWWFAGLGVDAVSHYWADRRTTLRRLAGLLGPGKVEFFDLGAPRVGHDDRPCMGTGAAHLDQAWHHLFLFITALILAWGAR